MIHNIFEGCNNNITFYLILLVLFELFGGGFKELSLFCNNTIFIFIILLLFYLFG
ncbi:hypothetical protein [Crassaminicella profunda]|uniref:hypothetical protein n=1 Tax=Crassaminicella profunda TaxID=1286698 RepID=UPI001CA6888C|nr:hypothetical protein [Crassaminicella profunda]QZY55640.1 hypothetical protein K7H06_01085 [Crassaminicella profunda]